MKKKVILVSGARPNFVKVSALIRVFENEKASFDTLIVHTGQHYDYVMSKVFFEELEIREPDICLGVGSGSHAEQTGRIMIGIEKVLREERADIVIVVGDVNSTIACALTAVKMGIRVVHVEAGLRSKDRSMPEEINRVLTDTISDYLFVTEPSGRENLVKEGIDERRIFAVGNVMVDTLLRHKEKAGKSKILQKLGLDDNVKGTREYALLTIHRASNTDIGENFNNIVDALEEIRKYLPIVFPCHPRTRKSIWKYRRETSFHFVGGEKRIGDTELRNERAFPVLTIPPLGYLDFLRLMSDASFVMTDSGGIQEETTVLGVPCITLRDNTERPITLHEGTNVIGGTNRDGIVRESLAALRKGSIKKTKIELWDGRASERIVRIIKDEICS